MDAAFVEESGKIWAERPTIRPRADRSSTGQKKQEAASPRVELRAYCRDPSGTVSGSIWPRARQAGAAVVLNRDKWAPYSGTAVAGCEMLHDTRAAPDQRQPHLDRSWDIDRRKTQAAVW